LDYSCHGNAFYIGLFGHDNTAFLADCALATESCNYDTYSEYYDGWAIGFYWYINPYVVSNSDYYWVDYYIGFCIAESRSCHGVETDTASFGYDTAGLYVYVSETEITRIAAPADYNYMDTYWYEAADYDYF